jgi:dihydropteroate synthase
MPTQIMGILNTSPNSFYANSRYISIDQAIERSIEIEKEGADLLDIGGCSTHPSAPTPPSIEEEIQRTIPLIRELKKVLKIPISIDTWRFEVANLAVEAGVDFLNDITGFSDPKMIKLAQESGLRICVMHMQNQPHNMQVNPYYQNGVVEEISSSLFRKAEELTAIGIPQEKIYLDPGIGFGKTVEDNLKILQDLEKFREAGCPLLIGISRKIFIQKLTQLSADKTLYGTLGLNSLLIEKNVEMIRVHDVAAHRDLRTVINAYKEINSSIR